MEVETTAQPHLEYSVGALDMETLWDQARDEGQRIRNFLIRRSYRNITDAQMTGWHTGHWNIRPCSQARVVCL